MQVGRNLSSGVQADDIAGNQISGPGFPRACPFSRMRAVGLVICFRASRAFWALPSCTTPTHAFTRMTVRIMTASLNSAKEHGNGCSHEEYENQRVVQLLQKGFDGRFAVAVDVEYFVRAQARRGCQRIS